MAYYVKSEPGYEQATYDRAKVKEAASRAKAKKLPTSVALDPEVVRELRAEAAKRDVPYQVLMRMLIVQGLNKLKKAA